eukprot:3666696-Amphidinium_carterae.2
MCRHASATKQGCSASPGPWPFESHELAKCPPGTHPPGWTSFGLMTCNLGHTAQGRCYAASRRAHCFLHTWKATISRKSQCAQLDDNPHTQTLLAKGCTCNEVIDELDSYAKKRRQRNLRIPAEYEGAIAYSAFDWMSMTTARSASMAGSSWEASTSKRLVREPTSVQCQGSTFADPTVEAITVCAF